MEQFKDALAKFTTYSPKSKIAPNWGKAEAEYFINELRNNVKSLFKLLFNHKTTKDFEAF
jgi:hypothetical protein